MMSANTLIDYENDPEVLEKLYRNQPEKFELESLSVSVMPEGLASVKNNYKWENLKQQAFKEFESGPLKREK